MGWSGNNDQSKGISMRGCPRLFAGAFVQRTQKLPKSQLSSTTYLSNMFQRNMGLSPVLWAPLPSLPSVALLVKSQTGFRTSWYYNIFQCGWELVLTPRVLTITWWQRPADDFCFQHMVTGAQRWAATGKTSCGKKRNAAPNHLPKTKSKRAQLKTNTKKGSA
jgi:hypothetical protein